MKENKTNDLAVVILAAGKGKRMNNPELPKVMSLLSGKPLIAHVLDQVKLIDPAKVVIIAGHRKESLIDFVSSAYKSVVFVEQMEQLGTGHAVAQAESALSDYDGNVLILSGDVPLLSSATIHRFIEEYRNTNADITVLTARIPDPFGYGRIKRDAKGDFVKITEQKDATEDEKKIDEVNGGVYLVNSKLLFDALKNVSNNNAQQEYYLTDIIQILKSRNLNVRAFCGADYRELQGVNSPDDLRTAEAFLEELYN